MAKRQFPRTVSVWNGFLREEFTVGGRRAFIVFPDKAVVSGKEQLWIWRPQFFDYKPIADLELVKRGYAAVFISMEDLYGSPKAMEVMDQFYRYLVDERKFSGKPVLFGLSRGGLYALNWAEKNPLCVAGVYVDAPVCDFKSWPATEARAKVRRMTGTNACAPMALMNSRLYPIRAIPWTICAAWLKPEFLCCLFPGRKMM